jgi:hypothetical protein
MLKKLGMDKFSISERRDQVDLATLFGDDATTAIFQCIKTTEAGRKRTGATNERDCWDIDGLGHDGVGEMTDVGGGIWGQ